jgi:glycosyltransferase involved in cell wall biosynthesis
MNMRISIAMATYNGAKYLQEQLNSFLAQTRLPDELIVCDDGSIDATLDILQDFRKHATFTVQIYRNEVNLGFTKNFEKALLKSSGNLIFLSDQDDVWFANKVEVMERAFLANPEKLLIVHDGKLVDEKLDWHGATKLGQVLTGFRSTKGLIMGALTVLRREILPCVLPIPDKILGHDAWLHNIAHLLDARLVLDKSLQSIRRHSSNNSNWIASSTKKIDGFDVLMNQLRTPVASGYEDRILINTSSYKRLIQLSTQGNMFSQNAIECSLKYLTLERDALKYRNSIPRVGSIKRKSMSLHFLLRGGYSYFNGFKSFLRDFTR